MLAKALGIPIELGAAVGLASVFATCANTPLALTVMAIELMGASCLPHVAIVTIVAYVLGGHRSIYPSQRLLRHKFDGLLLTAAVAVRDFRHRAKAGDDPRG